MRFALIYDLSEDKNNDFLYSIHEARAVALRTIFLVACCFPSLSDAFHSPFPPLSSTRQKPHLDMKPFFCAFAFI
jgi:hypothetical protein